MALKAVGLKLEEERIREIKKVAAVFHLSMTDVINDALKEYLINVQKDPFYRLTANVEEASPKESAEILASIENMLEDDLAVSSIETVSF